MQCGIGTGSPSRGGLWDLHQAVSNRSKRSLLPLDDNVVAILMERRD